VANPPPTHGPTTFDALGARLQAALGDGYVVEGRLGAGGFAVVYLVRDLQLKRKLAVKVLSPDVIESHSALERFRREAETVAQLSHPNIVPLHFVGQKDDLIYIVMQAIDGGSLAERLRREKQLPIDEASRIFAEVASALAYAHKHGVIHRDIKPQNVLLDLETGRSLVTDFGIARTVEGTSLTATGVVVGTPAYLSPEHVAGEATDHRADIYALGVMAYEMLAGQQPFTASTPTAMLVKRLAVRPSPLASVRKDVPKELEALVSSCLATDPEERMQSAADIMHALTGQLPPHGKHSGSRSRGTSTSRSTRVQVGAAASVILAVAIAGWLLKPRPTTRPAPAAPPVDSGMIVIPAGTYVIGNNDLDQTRPSHPVRLAAFGLDAHEVTAGEYARYVAVRGVPTPWNTQPADSIPVTGVRLAEAENYCAWRHPDGGRLPTEEEWEAAARGIEGRLYPWGREWDSSAANVATVGTALRRSAPTRPAARPKASTISLEMFGNGHRLPARKRTCAVSPPIASTV